MCVGVNSNMFKDTITNHRKFDFAEEVYEEIHKQAHLKQDMTATFICNVLESGKENKVLKNKHSKCTYQTYCDSNSEHHHPPYCFILFGFLLAERKKVKSVFDTT